MARRMSVGQQGVMDAVCPVIMCDCSDFNGMHPVAPSDKVRSNQNVHLQPFPPLDVARLRRAGPTLEWAEGLVYGGERRGRSGLERLEALLDAGAYAGVTEEQASWAPVQARRAAEWRGERQLGRMALSISAQRYTIDMKDGNFKGAFVGTVRMVKGALQQWTPGLQEERPLADYLRGERDLLPTMVASGFDNWLVIFNHPWYPDERAVFASTAEAGYFMQLRRVAALEAMVGESLAWEAAANAVCGPVAEVAWRHCMRRSANWYVDRMYACPRFTPMTHESVGSGGLDGMYEGLERACGSNNVAQLRVCELLQHRREMLRALYPGAVVIEDGLSAAAAFDNTRAECMSVTLSCWGASKALRNVPTAMRELLCAQLARQIWMVIKGRVASAPAVHLMPCWIVVENVEGLFRWGRGEAYERLMGALATLPYAINAAGFAASEANVPQDRRRLIITMVRRDLVDGAYRPEVNGCAWCAWRTSSPAMKGEAGCRRCRRPARRAEELAEWAKQIQAGHAAVGGDPFAGGAVPM